MQGVVVLDTSVLCCWLQVPGKETAGSGDSKWDFKRVDEIVKKRIDAGHYLVLPLATLLETGNHISQAQSLRFECAKELAKILSLSARGDEPWATFTEQAILFDSDKVASIAADWPKLAAGGTSIGDFMIVDVANYYASAGIKVEILTGDAGLKAYEPAQPLNQPRRRTKGGT